MADPRFFDKSKNFTLGELAKLAGAELASAGDADFSVSDVAALDQAGADHISFLDNVRYKDQFVATKAGACIVHPDIAPLAPKGVKLLLSKSPYKAYALIAQAFYPQAQPPAQIYPSANIHKDATLGEGCTVEAGVVIAAGAVLGKSCWVEAGAVIGRNVQVGDHCRIGPQSTLSHCHIGSYTRLYPGVRVGQDGFGFAIFSCFFPVLQGKAGASQINRPIPF